jgi:hypothetical protein
MSLLTLKAPDVLIILKSFSPFLGDLPETTVERDARLMVLSEELVDYANPRPSGWMPHQTVATLIAIAWHEATLAAYVARGQCENPPEGVKWRCDLDRKTGKSKARTYFQLHEKTCPALWTQEPGSREELRAAIACAAKTYRGALYSHCGLTHPAGQVVGAFAGYRSRMTCLGWSPTDRALTYNSVLARLWQPCAGAECQNTGRKKPS